MPSIDGLHKCILVLKICTYHLPANLQGGHQVPLLKLLNKTNKHIIQRYIYLFLLRHSDTMIVYNRLSTSYTGFKGLVDCLKDIKMQITE